ncbi:hypothetical protein FCM35_KLT00490 [Carex littledalei]|uniref:Uncharacterized protein n=1 Tax=Carex littledalei TaxID=544730 RepID=A0A833RJN8_9POAL|nr:hypothetical protein FCM35_KLT00490 [Carex littledalei]
MRAPIHRFETLARKRRKYPAPPLLLSYPPHSIDRREEHHQEMSGGRATPRYAPVRATLTVGRPAPFSSSFPAIRTPGHLLGRRGSSGTPPEKELLPC